MVFEDYTTYTKYDDNAHITALTAQHITHAAWTRIGYASYLYKDMDTNHFRDFTHQVNVNEYGNSNTHGCQGTFWMLSNLVGARKAHETAGEPFLYMDTLWHDSPNNMRMRVGYYNGTSYLEDLTDADVTKVGTWYYITINRSGITITAKIYTDSARTTLLDTLIVTDGGEKYQYVYACNTTNAEATAYDRVDNYIENLDLMEGAYLGMAGFIQR